MRYIDLFAGVGGFHYGIEKANLNYKCVYSNEWDKYANSVYRKHYERCDDKDIRTIKASEIPDHDLLCAGFPCQSFSIAGKRGGFSDTRGTLFFEIARIAKQKQPRLLLLENVKGLLSHDKGNTFGTILNTLDELGYDCQWQVLNSKDFGVPQNRERVFIVGHLRGQSRPEVFPLTKSSTIITKTKELSKPISNCLRTNYSNGKSNETYIRQPEINVVGSLNDETWSKRHESIRRVYGVDGISPTIPTGTGGGVMTKIADNRLKQVISGRQGNRVYDSRGVSATLSSEGGGKGGKTGLYAIPVTKEGNCYAIYANYHKGINKLEKKTRTQVVVPMRWQRTEKGKKIRRENQKLGNDYTPFTDGCRELVPSDKKEIGALTSQAINKDSLVGNSLQIRRLTPIECEKLQGFPTNWTKYGADGELISDTQRYKMMGNAVSTPVITKIIERLM